jgi:hypothetical protein
MVLHLIQAVFKLRVIQCLHDDCAWSGDPKIPARFDNVILKVTFLGDPQETAITADHITAPVTFEAPGLVLRQGNVSQGVNVLFGVYHHFIS